MHVCLLLFIQLLTRNLLKVHKRQEANNRFSQGTTRAISTHPTSSQSEPTVKNNKTLSKLMGKQNIQLTPFDRLIVSKQQTNISTD